MSPLNPQPKTITASYTLLPTDFVTVSTLSIDPTAQAIALTLPTTDRLTGATLPVDVVDVTNPVTLFSNFQNIANWAATSNMAGDARQLFSQLPLVTTGTVLLRCDGHQWYLESPSYEAGQSGFYGI
jgi:hypothetical protein